jgi:hypothetical protein
LTKKRNGQDSNESQHTRRQFIRNLLVASAYAAPMISSFSVSSARAASGSGGSGSKFSFMISKKKSPSPMMSPSGMMGGSGMMSSGTGMLWS